MSAWQTAPAKVAQAWPVAPEADITGFTDINCWHGWVVTEPVGKGNGFFVFSQAQVLHLLSRSELKQFSREICSSPDSPRTWKNLGDGPAFCNP